MRQIFFLTYKCWLLWMQLEHLDVQISETFQIVNHATFHTYLVIPSMNLLLFSNLYVEVMLYVVFIYHFEIWKKIRALVHHFQCFLSKLCKYPYFRKVEVLGSFELHFKIWLVFFFCQKNSFFSQTKWKQDSKSSWPCHPSFQTDFFPHFIYIICFVLFWKYLMKVVSAFFSILAL